jgi:predicted enzyme related to lactoylglutathione lyase
VLIYAKNIARASTYYERVLGTRLIVDDAGHRAHESPAVQLIALTIPAQSGDTIKISPPRRRRTGDRAIKPFFAVDDFELAVRTAEECGGVACGPVWPGRGLWCGISLIQKAPPSTFVSYPDDGCVRPIIRV